MSLKAATSVALALTLLPIVAFASDWNNSQSLGVAIFPGATHRSERLRPNTGKGTISLEGLVVAGVTADVFVSEEAPDKVLGFYRGELKRLGAITECRNGSNARVHVRLDGDAISNPGGCQPSDFGSGETEIKAIKNGEQFIITVGPRASGTEFAIVHVQSARKCTLGRCDDMM
jgi:hypothetical protein